MGEQDLAARLSMAASALVSYSEAGWFELTPELLPERFWRATAAPRKTTRLNQCSAVRRVKARLEGKQAANGWGVLAINRQCRADRRGWIQAGLDSLCAGGWDARLVRACDKRDIEHDRLGQEPHASYNSAGGGCIPGMVADFERLGAPFSRGQLEGWYARPANCGELALVHSNLKCLRMAVEQGWPAVLVLEDDCVPRGLFGQVAGRGWLQRSEEWQDGWLGMMAELARATRELRGPKWHLINLGPQRIGPDRGASSTRLCRSGLEWCTQAVLYSRAGAQLILDRADRLLGAAVAWDDMLACLQLGERHPIEWARTLWRDHYRGADSQPLLAFSFVEPLTAQLEALGAEQVPSDVTG